MRRRSRICGGKTDLSYLLRDPKPGDLGWIVRSHAELYFEEHGYGLTFEGLVAQVVADFARDRDPARERCWIAELEGRNVGSIMVMKGLGDSAKLRLFLIDPAARGLGLGKRLVAECVGFARRAGYGRIELMTHAHLKTARHLYARAGFGLVESEGVEEFGRRVVKETWVLVLDSRPV